MNKARIDMQFQKVAELSILTVPIEGDVHHAFFSAAASAPTAISIKSPKHEKRRSGGKLCGVFI